ncbi:hypothetical protein N8D74_02105 [Curtobacterium flaccumfaciens]|uniref:Uncharacterized protein n=1 Tax=Curtobacterium poinsettiae TaxID=159612 RepID=A0A9Q9P811_9MICO|nr:MULTISPECIES: hypothetical protein [Curtobacterium]MBO9039755.1 hypothetical protein [Curtobacterium flaccumfaciens pv. flaccumfaciens]MCS6562338.1 hypothetical protein [Curtobacterium flaccumfaciens pv. poinsettiae]UXN25698.1 hypothetical protein N8D74_02105 [Curtobacterium flaccumfaciens]UXN28402.1 hypothetical protein N8D75_15605 [Curtobacterium flaccumfaciens]UYC80537.1 hypothetical protein OE229_15685 [Curtobacterium flaccumfaciens pv. poinsettiae]
MNLDVIGAAIVSISGALFATASIWCLVGLFLRTRAVPELPAASRAHLFTSASTIFAGLVVHIIGFFPEAFVLIYGGATSMLVAAFFARTTEQPAPGRVAGPALLTAGGIVALTIGLLI